MFITTSNINEAKKQINKILSARQSAGGRARRETTDPITVLSHNLEFNRKIIEYGRFQIFIGLNKPLNHVMAKLASKNNITIALDLKTLHKLHGKNKAKTLSTIIQNIKFLRKAKAKLSLLNYQDEKNARDFLLSLGASTAQAKEATL